MQEHPVPQNVTGYEFHLIGQMTLKQFMEVAVGIVIAVLIYWTNLPVFVKYPLMGVAGLIGFGMAFIPLEGRPLDRWFFAFVKSIYQPTMFFWEKTDTTPGIFTYSPPKNLDTTPKIDYTPIRQSRLQEYVHTVKPAESVEPDEEASAANELLKLFSEASTTPSKTASTAPVGRVTEMQVEPAVPQTKPEEQKIKSSVLPEPSADVKQNNTIIETQRIGVTEEMKSSPVQQEQKPASLPGLQVIETSPHKKNTDTLQSPQLLEGFPFPNAPTTPNMLSGMVVTEENKIIEGAIITITRIADNTPVRAIKTNTLGQFSIVTPLEQGNYALSVEKDGLRFDKYSLVMNNQVVRPIIIRALR